VSVLVLKAMEEVSLCSITVLMSKLSSAVSLRGRAVLDEKSPISVTSALSSRLVWVASVLLITEFQSLVKTSLNSVLDWIVVLLGTSESSSSEIWMTRPSASMTPALRMCSCRLVTKGAGLGAGADLSLSRTS